ncbi:hypothetical protein FA95DRAFT_1071978 [Auriscalpium vulgare]|uniref:Uncharacterized protein n=1 Tax=Auriscalpium vulgare TaxID=40419 RepID=A0ACB8RWJ2_9AGAM|nr:hypothetical protein FA95DRAFT_1071978 [Auriscalpium vulgare]
MNPVLVNLEISSLLRFWRISPSFLTVSCSPVLDSSTKSYLAHFRSSLTQTFQSYFDQAAEVARIFNIKLTSRSWDGQRYLDILVQHKARIVALCEEFSRPLVVGSKPTFDRRVARVITITCYAGFRQSCVG